MSLFLLDEQLDDLLDTIFNGASDLLVCGGCHQRTVIIRPISYPSAYWSQEFYCCTCCHPINWQYGKDGYVTN